MLIPILKISTNYPYIIIQLKEVKFFKNKIVYEKHIVGNDDKYNDDQKTLINKNKQLLLDNQVSINKIRFVFSPNFTYDINNNIINPNYEMLIPINANNGKFSKNSPIIEINKPKKLIHVSVNNYSVSDNYIFIKTMVKKSKLGVVIMLADEITTLLNGKTIQYLFGVDSDVIRLIDLDDVINKLNLNIE